MNKQHTDGGILSLLTQRPLAVLLDIVCTSKNLVLNDVPLTDSDKDVSTPSDVTLFEEEHINIGTYLLAFVIFDLKDLKGKMICVKDDHITRKEVSTELSLRQEDMLTGEIPNK